jgi:type IV secretory pathway TrbL component
MGTVTSAPESLPGNITTPEVALWWALAFVAAYVIERLMSSGVKFFIFHLIPNIIRPLVFMVSLALCIRYMKQTRDTVMMYQNTPVVDLFKSYVQNFTEALFPNRSTAHNYY